MKTGPRAAKCSVSPGASEPRVSGGMCSASAARRHLRDGELVRATLERQKTHRERVFSQDLPFSWLRLLVGIVSVTFVLTDVARSGLGVSDLGHFYPILEPDMATSSGKPWDYAVFQATRDEASSTNVRVWSYKYDTTSVVWRAFAQHLNIEAFPECLHYRMPCRSSTMNGSVVFSFIDKIVDALANQLHSPPLPLAMGRRKAPRKLTLRTESKFVDRVHDFLLPSLFEMLIWRTNEATLFSGAALERIKAYDVCFGSARPFFCQQLWVNFDRSCLREVASCRQVGRVYTHTMRRLQTVQERFQNASVDLTYLTSSEDLQVSRLSASVEGNQRADISTIIRAQTCSMMLDHSECETIYVEDYRYEIDILVSDVVQWYRLLVVLRLAGQAYFYLRALTLAISCYYALGPRAPTKGETILKRWRKTAHLLSKVPTQCIVFGSPFPILCYTLAHISDASIMYRILEKRFISQNGIWSLSLRESVIVAAVQLRSVWVYAMLLHLIVGSVTWHRWSGWGNEVIDGITGVPEFLLTAMASVNITAHFRSTHFRSTRILRIQETVSEGSRATIATLRQHRFTHRGRGTDHLGGVVVGAKFLICLVVVVVIASVIRAAFASLKACRSGSSRSVIADLYWPLGKTPVPYSAGILWPAVSLCVHWTSDFFCIGEAGKNKCYDVSGNRCGSRRSFLCRHRLDGELRWHCLV